MRMLATVAAGLVLLHLVVAYVHFEVVELPWLFRSLFDLDEEQSFGTWFTAMILFLAAISCREARHDPEQKNAVHLGVLEAGFIVLSIDEIAGLHETLNTVTGHSWTYYGMAGAGLAGLYFVPFLLRISRAAALMLIISGFVYLGGALGVELASDVYDENDMLDTLEYYLSTGLEEAMEMAGILLFIGTVRRTGLRSSSKRGSSSRSD